MSNYTEQFVRAAKVANMTPGRFAANIRGILRAKKCRDTPRRKVFSAAVINGICRAS